MKTVQNDKWHRLHPFPSSAPSPHTPSPHPCSALMLSLSPQAMWATQLPTEQLRSLLTYSNRPLCSACMHVFLSICISLFLYLSIFLSYFSSSCSLPPGLLTAVGRGLALPSHSLHFPAGWGSCVYNLLNGLLPLGPVVVPVMMLLRVKEGLKVHRHHCSLHNRLEWKRVLSVLLFDIFNVAYVFYEERF